MAKKFPSELASRGTVKVTDKLLIHNIDTGATEYTTVTELFAALLTLSPTVNQITVSSGIINGAKSVTITNLNTWYDLVGTNGLTGILHIRDVTAGGSVALLYDPSSGASLLGTSGITGFAVTDIQNTGNPNYTMQIRLTSGATGRTLAWTLLR